MNVKYGHFIDEGYFRWEAQRTDLLCLRLGM